METQTSFVTWIALLLSVVALILGWVALNRSGTDFNEVIQERVEQATTELRLDYEQLEAEFRSLTADELQDAAQDIRTDENDSSTSTP